MGWSEYARAHGLSVSALYVDTYQGDHFTYTGGDARSILAKLDELLKK